jgi:hypothetical protein
MSNFMPTIEAAGFSDRPPVSNVMPLPTSAMWREALFREGGLVEDLDRDIEVGHAVGGVLGQLRGALPLRRHVHEVLDQSDGLAEGLRAGDRLIGHISVQGHGGGARLALLGAVAVEAVAAEHGTLRGGLGELLETGGQAERHRVEVGERTERGPRGGTDGGIVDRLADADHRERQ